MTRVSKQERRRSVLAAAAERIRQANVDWAALLTFGELAIDTGVDQAQISRDFGAKRHLVRDLVDHLVPDRCTAEADADTVPSVGGCDPDRAPSSVQALRGHMLLWAASGRGSHEWSKLAGHFRHAAQHTQAWLDQIADQAQTAAPATTGLTPAEAAVVVDALADGLAIRASVSPDLVPDDLMARLVRTVACSIDQPAAPDAGDEGPGTAIPEVVLSAMVSATAPSRFVSTVAMATPT